MNELRHIDEGRDFVEHSFIGTTWNKIKHKYIAKIKKKNGKYRYFYSQEEYDAYKKGNNIGIAPVLLRFILSKQVRQFVLSCVNEGLSQIISSEEIKKTEDYVTAKKYHYLYRVKKPNGTYRYFYTEDEYQAYLRNQTPAKDVTEYQDEEPDFMKDIPEAVPKTYKDINPNFDDTVYEYSHNCYYCTTAYELSQRGYDVQAAPKSEDINNTVMTTYDFYESPDIHQSVTIKEALHNLDNDYPDGSRGNLMFNYAWGDGHSVVWEKNNGKTVIKDAQTGEEYSDSYMLGITELITTDVFYVRTDNLELKEEIKRSVVYA